MSAPGIFNDIFNDMLPEAWQDMTFMTQGWFDPDMIQAPSYTPPPPAVRHLTRIGEYGLEYGMGYRMPTD